MFNLTEITKIDVLLITSDWALRLSIVSAEPLQECALPFINSEVRLNPAINEFPLVGSRI